MAIYFPAVKARKPVHMACGTLFTLLFVLCRLATIPFFVYALAVSADTRRAAAPHVAWWGPTWRAIELVAVPLPLLINVFWGRAVILGYLSAVRGALGSKAPAVPNKAA